MKKFYARTRDGIVVQVHTINVDRGLAQVTPAYKADPVWMDAAFVKTVPDPHAWTTKRFVGWLAVMIFWGWTCWGIGFKLAGHGFSPWYSGFIAFSLYSVWTEVSLKIFGINRQ